jgi:hypothetical protein
MCENAGCDGHHERVDAELLRKARERTELHAKSRGMAVDELLASYEPKDTIGERFRKLKF